MFAILLLSAFLATSTNAIGRQGWQAKSIRLASRGGFRLPNGEINGLALLRALNSTLSRYSSAPITESYIPTAEELREDVNGMRDDLLDSSLNATHGKRAATARLQSYRDTEYDGYMTVGSKIPTEFLMQFDTGSPYIVVPGLECTVDNGCPNTARYYGLGTPLQTSINLNYSGGSVSGFEWEDTVNVAGVNVTGQTIVSLVSANMQPPPFYDGVAGMSFSAAATDNAITFFENMIDQKLVAPEFSFFLGRNYNQTGDASELTFGGRNNSLFSGPVTFVPVVTQNLWIVDLDGVIVNGESAGPTVKGPAAIDTGTSFTVVPLSALAKIFALVPGSIAIPHTGIGTSQFQFYAYPCNTPAAYIPSITLAGTSFPIASQDFKLGTLNPRQLDSLSRLFGVTQAEIIKRELCVAGIMSIVNSINPDLFLLGDVFLKGWYAVFGYGEDWPLNKTGATVGFARVAQDAGPGGGVIGIVN